MTGTFVVIALHDGSHYVLDREWFGVLRNAMNESFREDVLPIDLPKPGGGRLLFRPVDLVLIDLFLREGLLPRSDVEVDPRRFADGLTQGWPRVPRPWRQKVSPVSRS